MQQQRIRSFILYTLAAVCVAGWGFFALRVLLPATLPFWLGLLIAAVLRPVTLLFSRLLRLKRRRAAVFVTALFFTLLGLLLWLLLTLLWGQFCSIAARLPQLYKTVFLPRWPISLSGYRRCWPALRPTFPARCSCGCRALLPLPPSSPPPLPRRCWLPAPTSPARFRCGFLTVVVTIFCSGFISLDYPKVMQLLLLPIPQKLRPGLARLKNFAATTLLRLVRAYLLLLLITFGELCLGLWLLGVGAVCRRRRRHRPARSAASHRHRLGARPLGGAGAAGRGKAGLAGD